MAKLVVSSALSAALLRVRGIRGGDIVAEVNEELARLHGLVARLTSTRSAKRSEGVGEGVETSREGSDSVHGSRGWQR